jgi:hypothetical protein
MCSHPCITQVRLSLSVRLVCVCVCVCVCIYMTFIQISLLHYSTLHGGGDGLCSADIYPLHHD